MVKPCGFADSIGDGMTMITEYQVREYRKVGHELRFVSVISGMGKNKGTWNSTHSRSAAYKHCARLNACKYKPLDTRYKVEEVNT